jgi:hypothetical protein
MQPRIYTYKITFIDTSYYYYGVHKEKYFDEEYWGSPITNKWCWELYEPVKQILEFFNYSDEGWLKANQIEKQLIKPFYNTDKWCLNGNCGGIITSEILRKFATGRTHQCGEKNSQYGKIWINDGNISRKILKSQIIPYGYIRGRCKTQTQNYCVDCKVQIGVSHSRCNKCSSIKKGIQSRKFEISKEELMNLIQNYPITKVGKILGVSDNAVRKRCKTLGISNYNRFSHKSNRN